MKCPYCGATIDDNASMCIECGKKLIINADKPIKNQHAFFAGLFSLLLPPLGLILYIIHLKRRPNKAKVCLRNTLIGLFLYILVFILIVLIWLFIIVGIFTS